MSGRAQGSTRVVEGVSLADQSSKLTDVRPSEGFASVEGSRRMCATDQ
jgi:hypothetical protein